VTYDEEAELTRYVWRNHPSLLSPFESQVERAAHARHNFADGTGEHARRVMERYGRLDDPRIDAALIGGWEAFRRSACRRVLAEQSALPINRCPRCHRVLRTPVATQCFWCGCDWHR
jgi:hypothetical protein